MDFNRIMGLEGKGLCLQNVDDKSNCMIIMEKPISMDKVSTEDLKACGCFEIEGTRISTAYQSMVGILLSNNYAVKLEPMEERTKLKITIYESEEK